MPRILHLKSRKFVELLEDIQAGINKTNKGKILFLSQSGNMFWDQRGDLYFSEEDIAPSGNIILKDGVGGNALVDDEGNKLVIVV